MEELTFQLKDFEGPLDLLLHLVSKNKMDLYDVNIALLIEQYLTVMHAADAYEMESASSFIEMAARLVQMKSFLLLPKSEEAERMRAELTGMLVEYSLCKQVAEKLRAMAGDVYTAVREPFAVEFETEYTFRHDVEVLEAAYNALHGRGLRKRQPRQEQFEPIVQAPFVSVTSRIIFVLRGLMTGRVAHLRELFSAQNGRSQTVATFLAVLELMRAGRITIDGAEKLSIHKGTKVQAQARSEEEASWN